jgi:hypothetical protein
MNEHIEPPRRPTHAESDFLPVRGNRSQAVISRGKIRLVYAVVALVVLLTPRVSSALPISLTDLWDTSQGSTVVTHTGTLSGAVFDIRNMFGFGGAGGQTLFADYRGAGYVHAVEWQTSAPVTLLSFSLWAQNEGMDRRAFNRFTLFSDSGGTWQEIYDTGPGFSYPSTPALNLEQDVTPVTAQDFRAEFVQAPYTSGNASGPRILELDGFDTYLDGSVPEPATLSLLALGGLAVLRRRRRRP